MSKKIVWMSVNNNAELKDQSQDRQNLNLLTRDKSIIIGSAIVYSRIYEHEDFENNIPMPAYNFTSGTFADATDAKAIEIMRYAETNDLPIVVMWSGGIDSTVILSAIIKHWPRYLLDRVVVQMTNASYLEHPFFFHDVIEKYQLKYTSVQKYDYHTAIIIHGDPADALWIQGHVLNTGTLVPNAYKLDVVKNAHVVINWLMHSTTFSKEWIIWFYQYMLHDQMPANIKIETIEDFMWWVNFNYNYSALHTKHFAEVITPLRADSYELFQKNFKGWYVSDEYQLWSIHTRNTDIKYNGTTRSFKMPAKEYIFDLDKNRHYRDYKTKVNSRYYESLGSECLYNDGSVITNDSRMP